MTLSVEDLKQTVQLSVTYPDLLKHVGATFFIDVNKYEITSAVRLQKGLINIVGESTLLNHDDLTPEEPPAPSDELTTDVILTYFNDVDERLQISKETKADDYTGFVGYKFFAMQGTTIVDEETIDSLEEMVWTPHVSQEGILSWTNNKGLQNPEPVNIKGEKGDKGDRGEQGIQGERGLQGVQGIQGEAGKDGVSVESITDDDGDGIATISYSDGTIEDLQLPRGLQGEKGEQGIQGEKGEDGASNASEVSITDVNDLFISTNVEDALVELANKSSGSSGSGSEPIQVYQPESKNGWDVSDVYCYKTNDNIVHVYGEISNGTRKGTNSEMKTLFTLPEGFRPTEMVYIPAVSFYNGNSLPVGARLYLNSSGTLRVGAANESDYGYTLNFHFLAD